MHSMDEAPRDGTRILIKDGKDGQFHSANWDGEDWYMCDVDIGIDTHIIDVDDPQG